MKQSFVVPCLWQALKEALAQIRVCSRLEGLLLKKKFLNNGDTPEVHAQKVCFSLAVGGLGALLGYFFKTWLLWLVSSLCLTVMFPICGSVYDFQFSIYLWLVHTATFKI